MNGGMPHGILVDQAVNRLGQRLNIQPAAAENIEEEGAQLLALERFGDLQHIMDLQTAPKLLCLAGLAHREKQPFRVPTLAPVMISGVQSSACRACQTPIW